MSPRRISLTRRLQKTIYIRFSHNWIAVECVEDQCKLEDVPIVAQDHRGRVLAFGSQVHQLSVSSQHHIMGSPFTHPRMCISDFDAAEYTLRTFVRAVLPRWWVKPAMIVHPLDSYEGGLTQVETHVLLDLLLNLGAREAYVWVGRQLMNSELRHLQFPVSEGTLHARNDPRATG